MDIFIITLKTDCNRRMFGVPDRLTSAEHPFNLNTLSVSE